ncbi:MAG TPA: SDR family NAD(P)-dependent oxidoreductase, partial [Myxococcota bacterium]|nr:SDR family NAD(P)-dependent oxidoreductase [Myxococcota bacterium]
HKGQLWTLRHGKVAEAVDAPLGPHAVVVATGGARGVTFELVRELARTQALRIVILARTGGVEESASPIKGLNDSEQKDRAKAALTSAGKRATPAEVKRWIENERTRLDITKNLESLRALGSEVELIACDVADLSALGRVVDGIKARHGHVDLLVHGAGREESKLLADKDPEAFERVFAPKARAGLSLYVSLKPKRMLTMGSVAGRFGNAGQADYSASNELLAALSRADGRDIVNVDWTAWGDVGMATKDAVKHVLESSGVEFLPAAIGARLGAALALSTFKGDVVVAGELGLFAPADAPAKTEAKTAAPQPGPAKHPAIFDRVDGNVYVRRLDPKRDIGLDHHRLDGVALLPGVIGLELMTQAAMHAAGSDASRIENVKFASPVKLHRDEPLDARVEVTLKDGHADVQLCTELVSPTGKSIRREHFAATVHFGKRETLTGPAIRRLEMPRDPGIERSAIYKRYFHGPVFQVLGRISVFGEDGAEAKSVTPWPTWMNGIGHQQLFTVPFAREAAFQGAGLWEMAELGRMALPAGVDRVELGAPLPAGTEVTVEARLVSSNANGSVFDVWTRDADGRIHDIMRGYRTVTLKQLAPEDRFETTYRRELTPNWLSVEIDEIHESLAADEKATLKRYLAPQEQARFKELKTDKRKIDWLAGRIVAKRLIRESHFAHDGAIVPYSAINIVPDELGAPQVSIAGEKAGTQRISISHSAGCAAAMLSVEPGVRPGIDVESVEARDPSFIRDYFTDAERAAANGRDPAHLFTAVWAVKEAVVKALGIGARVDLREIEAVPRMSAGSETWHVTLSGEALQRAELLGAGTPRVELETMASRVVARVLMPVNEQRATPSRGKPEVSA